MIIRWLMSWIHQDDTHPELEKPEEIAENRTFTRFPELPTELRVQIWEHYFNVPRIHLLFQGPLKAQYAFNGYHVAYADLTARTNHDVSPELRFAAATINREALDVFRKTFDFVHMNFMDIPSKQLRDLFDGKVEGLIDAEDPGWQALSVPAVPKPLLHSFPQLASLVKRSDEKPQHPVMPGIHINWEKDLLYLTDGGDVTCDMLRRMCIGPFASKLRRLAILVHDSYTYTGWRPYYGPSADFPNSSAKLIEVFLVVRLKDLEKEPLNAKIERDEFGFAPYDSVVQGTSGSWEWMQNMKMIERRFVHVAQLLREGFPDLEGHQIKWAVDIDYTYHKAETRYARSLR